MWRSLYQAWLKRRLKQPAFDFLFAAAPPNEWVCFDCETTGLNPKQDKIVSLSAIKICGDQVLTSQSLNLKFKQTEAINPDSIVVHRLRNVDVEQGLDERDAIEQFLRFIGSRPLVGYYLDFDVAMVNQIIKPWLGIGLPNQQIEVSELYYKHFFKSHAPHQSETLDLSFHAILEQLAVPQMGQHDAFNDALMTALIYIKLQHRRKS